MQEWQAALALLEDLLRFHTARVMEVMTMGQGKSFFVSSKFGPRLRDSQSYRSFCSHKTFENCSSNIIIEIPLHFTYSWSANF